MKSIPEWMPSSGHYHKRFLALRENASTGRKEQVIQGEIKNAGEDAFFTSMAELVEILGCKSTATVSSTLKTFVNLELIEKTTMGAGSKRCILIKVL